MALRERNVLQQVGVCVWIKIACACVNALNKHHWPASCLQIVNLIEETGHFNVTNTTFDFDLFSLDESTVRKLQSYLEATATWQEVHQGWGEGGGCPFSLLLSWERAAKRWKSVHRKWKEWGNKSWKGVNRTVFWGGSAAMWRLDCKPTLQHFSSLLLNILLDRKISS